VRRLASGSRINFSSSAEYLRSLAEDLNREVERTRGSGGHGGHG
jgi:hypothetical protein